MRPGTLRGFPPICVQNALAAFRAARAQLAVAYEALQNAFAEVRSATVLVDAFMAKVIDRCKGFLGRT